MITHLEVLRLYDALLAAIERALKKEDQLLALYHLTHIKVLNHQVRLHSLRAELSSLRKEYPFLPQQETHAPKV